MDYLWTPWRYAYITTADVSSSGETCIFCELLRLGDDLDLPRCRSGKGDGEIGRI